MTERSARAELAGVGPATKRCEPHNYPAGVMLCCAISTGNWIGWSEEDLKAELPEVQQHPPCPQQLDTHGKAVPQKGREQQQLVHCVGDRGGGGDVLLHLSDTASRLPSDCPLPLPVLLVQWSLHNFLSKNSTASHFGCRFEIRCLLTFAARSPRDLDPLYSCCPLLSGRSLSPPRASLPSAPGVASDMMDVILSAPRQSAW